VTRKPSYSSLACLRLLVAVGFAFATVIPASAEWKEKVLYSFQGGTNDGSVPVGSVVFDKQGNLYGVLQNYGSESCLPIGYECGAVFQLSPPAQKGDRWTETLIYRFKGKESNDGESPNGGLIMDSAGNLYGVTAYGGTGDCVLLGGKAGCGTVYKISAPTQKGGVWKETILYSFPTSKQGYLPNGNLVFDSAGNLYGATTFGGTKGTTCDAFYGGQCGIVFELIPPKKKGGKWTETVLHNFAGGTLGKQFGDGAHPNGGLILASNNGVLSAYGTTPNGGDEAGTCEEGSEGFVGCGVVFSLTPSGKSGAWSEEILHRFSYASDGAGPSGGLTFDATGSLYGAAGGGGSYESGLVFRLSPTKEGDWTESVLYEFTGGDDGQGPASPLQFDSLGNLFGTAIGGADFSGVVFRLSRPSRSASDWRYTLLHSFIGAPDGKDASGPLVWRNMGDLYGVAGGGSANEGCVFTVWP
jgi:hypothetical protein